MSGVEGLRCVSHVFHNAIRKACIIKPDIGKGDTSEFPPSMMYSHVPHLDLLGAPKGTTVSVESMQHQSVHRP